jgi:hypothetical protein
MQPKILPELDILQEYFHYNKDTGDLTTKKRLAQRVPEGTVLRSKSMEGYLKVRFQGSSYPVHRIAWKLATGQEPVIIDHINHEKDDNRFQNLRSVTYQVNGVNRKHARGFAILPNGTYRVTLCGGDVGYFLDEDSAREAYKKAKYESFGV